jgi:antitoxin ChpS
MFAIPKSLLEGLGMRPDQQVEISLSEGRMIVKPHRKPRYTLDALMAQCHPESPMSEEEQEWLAVTPIGREAL